MITRGTYCFLVFRQTASESLLGRLWRCSHAHESNEFIKTPLKSKLTIRIFIAVDGAQKNKELEGFKNKQLQSNK